MIRQAQTRGWIAIALVLVAVTAATAASFSGNGVQVEAAGVEMTLKASVDKGVTLFFAAT